MTLARAAAFGAMLLAGCGLLDSAATVPPTIADCAMRWRATVHELGGRAGVLVVDADGVELLAIAADEGFVPASNTKLLSAAVALQTLGPAAALTTGLSCSGSVQATELDGDLILRGGGDPGFGPAQLAPLVAAVRALGVRRVAGRVRVDDSWLGAERRGLGWEWNDLGEDYAAPFGGLCWDGNVALVRVGDAMPRRVAVEDPAAAARAALVAALADSGIEVAGGDVSVDGWQRSLVVVPSAPVAELLRPMLTDSDNLYAEQLWRAAARIATGDGSTAGATAHAERTLRALGVDTTGLVQVDGSGLSRLNLVRPRQLVAVLSAMRCAPYADAFFAALPSAGRGTLPDRLGALGDRVRAKTGTLTRVAALSGTLVRGDGRQLRFGIVWNDFLCDADVARCAIDRFVECLAETR